MIQIQQLVKLYPNVEKKIVQLYYNQVNFIYQNYERDQREKIIFNRLDSLSHKLSQVEKKNKIDLNEK
jgi:hypothetical protein